MNEILITRPLAEYLSLLIRPSLIKPYAIVDKGLASALIACDPLETQVHIQPLPEGNLSAAWRIQDWREDYINRQAAKVREQEQRIKWNEYTEKRDRLSAKLVAKGMSLEAAKGMAEMILTQGE